MLFDTFLFHFELRTGCIVMSILHLLLSFAALDNVIHQTKFYFLIVLSARIFEICLSLFLLFASVSNDRALLKLWMLFISPVFLFNIFYSGYESLVKYDSFLGLLLLLTLYVITISLMVAHSFYNELGLIEDYLKDLAELRALRSAEQTKELGDSSSGKIEMVALNAMKARVRDDSLTRGQPSDIQDTQIDNLGTTPDRKMGKTTPTNNQASDSSVDSIEIKRERTALTSLLHRNVEENESSQFQDSSETEVPSVRGPPPNSDSSETEPSPRRPYIPPRSGRGTRKPPK